MFELHFNSFNINNLELSVDITHKKLVELGLKLHSENSQNSKILVVFLLFIIIL